MHSDSQKRLRQLYFFKQEVCSESKVFSLCAVIFKVLQYWATMLCYICPFICFVMYFFAAFKRYKDVFWSKMGRGLGAGSAQFRSAPKCILLCSLSLGPPLHLCRVHAGPRPRLLQRLASIQLMLQHWTKHRQCWIKWENVNNRKQKQNSGYPSDKINTSLHHLFTFCKFSIRSTHSLILTSVSSELLVSKWGQSTQMIADTLV